MRHPRATHMSNGVIIYQGGLSVRHPKGARSIGIGHPRSGDRCTETLPYPLDPLRVAEQKSSFPATHKGSRPNAYAYTSVIGTSCLDRCIWNGHPCGCRYAVRAYYIWAERPTRPMVPPQESCDKLTADRGDAYEHWGNHIPGGSSVRHPKGARSIGIGHPRSGDRCTKTLPYPSTPCGSPSRNPLTRRPARGRGLMRTLIHRSSALRASTDAYGTGILADAGVLSEPVY